MSAYYVDQFVDLERRIPEWMAQVKVEGLSIAIIQDGQIVWCQGFGVKRADNQEPITPETVFEAASLSKPVFAYAALKLVEKGLLDLDAPLTRYLPEPYIPDDLRLSLITARDVLRHTTGFPNGRPKDGPLQIRIPPGERFSYSGEGFLYLQKVVERLTGQPLEAYAQEAALRPLKMFNSSYLWLDSYETLAAWAHDDEGKPVEHWKTDSEGAHVAYSLRTTPSEFARFMIALLQPPERSEHLLSAEIVAEMLRPQVQVDDLAAWDSGWPDAPHNLFESVYWGLGWGLQRRADGSSFWHWGDNGGAHAFALGIPAQRAGMVAMTNSAHGRALWNDLFPAVFDGEHPALKWLDHLYE